ncbi:DUF1269 domain-containing protein [Rickettsiales bacterium]|nr:DUF1269 domain-containing protein [Rickettsiales bacterium]
MQALKKHKTAHAENACIAIFDTHIQAESAIKSLQKAGYKMEKLSIVGKDYKTEEHVVGYYNMGDRVKYWGKSGAFWGSIWGLLFGSAFLVVPGVGHLVLAGPLVATLVGALQGAVTVGGLSALGAALYSIGIPKDSIVQYETALKAEKFLLIAHGTGEDVEKAQEILKTTDAKNICIHNS